jgi:NADH-quinone oxidoreductase subunit M
MDQWILTLLTFVPVTGAAVILCVPSEQKNTIRWLALLTTGICLLLAMWLFNAFDRANPAMQFVVQMPWIPSFHIEYHIGLDGLSVSMVLLTALITLICIPASWSIDKGVKGYFALLLLLQTGMQGVFVSLDFFLFYVFWEIMLLPMYFLIGIWGGPRKEYAAIKFFLYTLAGSVLLLLAMLAMYFNTTDPVTGEHTFNMLVMMDQANHSEWLRAGTIFGRSAPLMLWMAMFIGFAIKVPLFPFHTWLPDAHVEAPTAISVILAGVLLKMGTYGILRFNYPMLPDASHYFSTFLAVIGVVNIVYGAFCALAQTDLKRLVAYSSISHMGYVILGMSAFTVHGINGAVFQMFNHGTITAMLFLLVGVIYDRAHHRYIVFPNDYHDPELRGQPGFGGLWSQMPIYGSLTMVAYFAALGLPGLSGFISEVLCFLGAFQVHQTLTIIGTLGVLLGAAYMLWAFQRLFMGSFNERNKDLAEINAREIATLVPLAVIVIILGVYPMPVLDLISASLSDLSHTLSAHSGMAMSGF